MSPGRVYIGDLPRTVAAQISGSRPASRGVGQRGRRSSVVSPSVETAPRSTWTCHTCGEVGTTMAGLERHADTARHYRIDTL